MLHDKHHKKIRDENLDLTKQALFPLSIFFESSKSENYS